MYQQKHITLLNAPCKFRVFHRGACFGVQSFAVLGKREEVEEEKVVEEEVVEEEVVMFPSLAS